MTMKFGTDSIVKLPALKMRSSQLSGLRAARMARGIASANETICERRIISRSIGKAARIVLATEVCEMNETPRLPCTTLPIHVKYCS